MQVKNQKKSQGKQRQKIPRFQDVETLMQRIETESPEPGDYLYEYKLKEALKNKNTYEENEFQRKFKVDFLDLPISLASKRSLEQRRFRRMTEIQRCVIPHALAGRDIVGASKTGSGKTLSYLIPIIENLYRNKWTPLDGLGALIILPTRELAMQVFEVFNSITQGHILSVGLLIGGKNIKFEQQAIANMNVLICTPGRLLQHLEETPGFETYNLKMLIIDEADTLFEMGFWEALQTIIAQIPKQRQTLLFSATLSKDIHQLTSMQMQSPQMIILHDKDIQFNDSTYETPHALKQNYMVIKIEEKLDVLFSFLKSHINSKVLVFLSSCKQVRFVYEVFRKLRIGSPVFELHGRQKQAKRMAIYFTFAEKKFATLITTNVASRGLDFPKVDWVVQVDCPEDVPTYIHRMGRTARYKAGGNSLLMLQEHELPFLDKLKQKKLEIKQIHLNPNKQLTIKNTVQAYVSEDPELKYLAQRAFISYMRSVYLANDKQVFDVMKINANDLAESYGLVQTPVIRFKRTQEEKQEDEPQETQKKSKLLKLKEKIDKKKAEKLLLVENDDKLQYYDMKHLKTITRERDISHKQRLIETNTQEDLEGGLFRKKQQLDPLLNQKPQLEISKRQLKKIKLDGHFGGKNKTFFDEQGNTITYEQQRLKEIQQTQQNILSKNVDYTDELILKVQENAIEDKKLELQRRKARRLKRKQQQLPIEEEEQEIEEVEEEF